MTTIKFYITAQLMLLLTVVCFAQVWEGPFTTLSSQAYATVIYENENHSDDPIVVGVEVSAQTRTWIYGSDQTPPWTSKFTPKVNSFFTANYGVRNLSIPAGYEHVVTHSYTRETGEQMWTREFEEYVEVAIRDRLWDTPAPGAISWVTRIIQ